jgi:hypothetical protein
MTKSNIAPSKARSVAANEVTPQKAIAAIAALRAPTLGNMSVENWIVAAVHTIGSHPGPVLDMATLICIGKCKFPVTIADIVDAVVASYDLLDMPMNGRARIHAAARVLEGGRYTFGMDGRKRFVAGAIVCIIGRKHISGVHANMLLDRVVELTVDDVEAAFVHASKGGGDDPAIDTLIDRAEYHGRRICVKRMRGEPEKFAGGPIATRVNNRDGSISELASPLIALSQEWFDQAIIKEGLCKRTAFDVAKCAINGDWPKFFVGNDEDVRAVRRQIDRLTKMINEAFFAEYGTTLQAKAEAAVDEILATTARLNLFTKSN